MGHGCITQRAQSGGTLWQPRGVGWKWGAWGKLKGEGTHVFLCLTHVVRQKPIQYYKAIILQLKINLKNCIDLGASLVAHMVENLPVVQETRVWSLGQEDSLEKGMATHSSILVWRIPWTEEPDVLQSVRLQRVGHDWATNTQSL